MKQKTTLAVHTFSHFCVDFSCFTVLFSTFWNEVSEPQLLAVGFLLYNILAFGLQPVFGYLCDRTPRIPAALSGCATVFLGCLPWMPAWGALVVCALGNAVFHVGGGIDSLVYSGGRMARSGVFVSSGALGVAFGTLAGKAGGSPWLPLVLLLGCILLQLGVLKAPSAAAFQNVAPFGTLCPRRTGWVVLLACFLAITIRGYVGLAVPIGWNHTALLSLLPGVMGCLGKACGGFLGDRLGARKAGCLSLLLSIPLLCFGYQQVVLCCLGLFFFQMAMPITLCMVAGKLPSHPGLAFGVTTLGLLCGTIPTYFFALSGKVAPAVLAVLVAVCLWLVFFCTAREKRRDSIL